MERVEENRPSFRAELRRPQFWLSMILAVLGVLFLWPSALYLFVLSYRATPNGLIAISASVIMLVAGIWAMIAVLRSASRRRQRRHAGLTVPPLNWLSAMAATLAFQLSMTPIVAVALHHQVGPELVGDKIVQVVREQQLWFLP